MRLARLPFTRFVPIVKADQVDRLVYGIVAEPDVAVDGETMTAGEIRKAAQWFLERYAQQTAELGLDHERVAGRRQLPVVESYLAPADFTLGTQRIPKGAWVLAAKCVDDELWARVQSGWYTGWSFEGTVRVVAE